MQDEETPPRAWGRRSLHGCDDVRRGNTPTCVGKTQRQARPVGGLRKHPHVRGEDSKRARSAAKAMETPPRAWGRHCSLGAKHTTSGNTPTCVGKTTKQGLEDQHVKKHPHVRGEDGSFYAGAHRPEETPPRAWGRRALLGLQGGKLGNTPTCVGKTGYMNCKYL